MSGNPFLKYLAKGSKGDFIHSSAYAKIQSGDSMGAASMQSFDERQKIELNRQKVRKYNDSKLVQQARIGSLKAVDSQSVVIGNSGARGNSGASGGVVRGEAMIQRRSPGNFNKKYT